MAKPIPKIGSRRNRRIGSRKNARLFVGEKLIQSEVVDVYSDRS